MLLKFISVIGLLAIIACQPGAIAPGAGMTSGAAGSAVGDTTSSESTSDDDVATPPPETPPVYAARDSGGGVLSAPSTREGIETFEGNVRVIGWEAGVARDWRYADEFFRMLGECETAPASCRIPEETAGRAFTGEMVKMPGRETVAGIRELSQLARDERFKFVGDRTTLDLRHMIRPFPGLPPIYYRPTSP